MGNRWYQHSKREGEVEVGTETTSASASTTGTERRNVDDAIIEYLMSRSGAERGADVVLNEPGYEGRIALHVRVSDSHYPAYLILLLTAKGETHRIGSIDDPRQRVTDAICRHGRHWIVTDYAQALRDLGQPLSMTETHEGKILTWRTFSACWRR